MNGILMEAEARTAQSGIPHGQREREREKRESNSAESNGNGARGTCLDGMGSMGGSIRI